MNLEKLKGKCRWCRYHLESRETYEEMCLLCQKMNAEYELKWELHPDIAETITEAIKLEKDTMKQWLLDEGYEILSEKI